MTNKHTKAPWVNTDGHITKELAHDMHKSIASTSNGMYADQGNVSEEEDEANANLIAAAPEMLAALEGAEYIIDDLCEDINTEDNEYLEQIAAIKAVINKAKGL